MRHFYDNDVDSKIQQTLEKLSFKNLATNTSKHVSMISKKFKLTEDDAYNTVIKYIKGFSTMFQITRDQKQVEVLRNSLQFVQRTPEWFAARKKIITASDIGYVLNMAGSREKIFKKKLSVPKKFMTSAPLEHGKCFEDVAISIYERRHNTHVEEFGLLLHPTIDFLGASPDGITREGIMLEIKCPYSRQIDGNIFLKKQTIGYWVQMQIQMEVCDLDFCHFLECEIKLYDDISQYHLDGQDRIRENGYEKGVVGEIFNNSTKEYSYLYPPFDLSTSEQLGWLDNEFKEYDKKSDCNKNFWMLNQISVVHINRDKQWFKNIYPKLVEFWDELQARKTNPSKYVKAKKNKGPDFSVCMF